MKEVLIISYYFPPLGMGGVQRPLKWAKYLPDFGWKSRVLTVKDIVYYARDYSLLKEVEGINIYRTESLDPLRVAKRIKRNKKSDNFKSSSDRGGRLFRKFLNYWFIPDIRILWIPFVIVAAAKIIDKNRQIGAVITTSPPNSTHMAGYWIKKIFRIGWVADLRDDWVFEIEKRSPTALHRIINRFVYRTVLKEADEVIAVSEGIAKNHKEMIRHDDENVTVIRNGFDREDLEKIKPETEDKFTVVYIGSITPYTNPEVFLQSVAIACNQNKELRENFYIKFIGSVIDVDLQSIIKKLNLSDNVKIYGYREHEESLNILSGSDAALLLISSKLGEGMVTGKLYEYIGMQKYIIALIPDCEGADILREYGNASIVKQNDVNGALTVILNLYEEWKNRKSIYVKPYTKVGEFERKNQVEILSGLLDSVCK